MNIKRDRSSHSCAEKQLAHSRIENRNRSRGEPHNAGVARASAALKSHGKPLIRDARHSGTGHKYRRGLYDPQDVSRGGGDRSIRRRSCEDVSHLHAQLLEPVRARITVACPRSNAS